MSIFSMLAVGVVLLIPIAFAIGMKFPNLLAAIPGVVCDLVWVSTVFGLKAIGVMDDLFAAVLIFVPLSGLLAHELALQICLIMAVRARQDLTRDNILQTTLALDVVKGMSLMLAWLGFMIFLLLQG